MYSYSIYIGLKVVPIQVLWGQSIYYLGTWTLRDCWLFQPVMSSTNRTIGEEDTVTVASKDVDKTSLLLVSHTHTPC